MVNKIGSLNTRCRTKRRECPVSERSAHRLAGRMNMARGSTDQRVTRTRERLKHAHLALILDKGYAATTVKDICDAARVGRSTFYAHYTSKDDLRRSSLEQLRKELFAKQKDALASAADDRETCLSFSLPMFQHARSHMHIYRVLKGSRGADVALKAIRRILSDLARNERVMAALKGATEREVAIQHVVGAFMSVLIWWLERGAIEPPDRIDAIFNRLASLGMR